ncbi:MAG: ABC transporter ATP-binding protein [Bacilli bacterium]|nr:ABC transporter ATP-binding protein [Bacilli bacterium]
MKTIVRLENVSKSFEKDKYVINNLSLDVYEGEFLTLLGSSGCGKTTILRMISGLEHVTDGKVYIDDKDVTELDPTKREVNTIFQNFALFPHMTVFENVSFGLRMKKVSKKEIESRVKKVLKLVELDGYEDRYPSQLSGGQQQRVAIARGIVMNPKVLLLDESLASLDLKLKRMMQIELKKIQRKLGITFIYVTHDQDEALTMSDRIIIIEKGVIKQEGSPQEIYQNPNSTFVADFIGESNLLTSTIDKINDTTIDVKFDNKIFVVNREEEDNIGDKVYLMIRPENVLVSNKEINNSSKGIIKTLVYDGAVTKLFVDTEGDFDLKVNVQGNTNYKEGDTLYIAVENKNIVPIREKKNEKRR